MIAYDELDRLRKLYQSEEVKKPNETFEEYLVNVHHFVVCKTCDGTGLVHSHNNKCWDCHGIGVVNNENQPVS